MQKIVTEDYYPEPNEWSVDYDPAKWGVETSIPKDYYRPAKDFHDPVRATQVGGSHYKDMNIQPWDAMEQWMTPEEFQGFLAGNVIKYLARHKSKGGTEDLKKAKHYLDKLIDLKEKNK